jgi:hypothetical protein
MEATAAADVAAAKRAVQARRKRPRQLLYYILYIFIYIYMYVLFTYILYTIYIHTARAGGEWLFKERRDACS